MHSCPQFWLLWRQCPFFSAFSSTVFMWRNFSNCPLISLLRCGAREIREYYLALTLPLFHWPRILLVSLYIFLEIIRAYSIGKFEVIKRGYYGEGVRLLQREWEESVRELSRSVRLLRLTLSPRISLLCLHRVDLVLERGMKWTEDWERWVYI